MQPSTATPTGPADQANPANPATTLPASDAASLKQALRVSDLTGPLVIDPTPVSTESSVSRKARRADFSVRLRLDWYDAAVVSLFVAALVAGLACLLRGA